MTVLITTSKVLGPEYRRKIQRSIGRSIVWKISTLCLMEASLLPPRVR